MDSVRGCWMVPLLVAAFLETTWATAPTGSLDYSNFQGSAGFSFSGSAFHSTSTGFDPTFQDHALCGLLIAFGSIGSGSKKWGCNFGLTDADPCSSGLEWEGVSCDGGFVSAIHFDEMMEGMSFSSYRFSFLDCFNLFYRI